jgi:hypothetical protein
VIVGPSQATGRWSLVRPLSLAAVAAGAHGLIVEVTDFNQALSDGAQSLDFENFDRLMDDSEGCWVRWPSGSPGASTRSRDRGPGLMGSSLALALKEADPTSGRRSDRDR